MDLKNIKQLVDLMKRADLTDFEIEEDGLKLKISREGSQTTPAAPAVTYMQPAPSYPAAHTVPPFPTEAPAAAAPAASAAPAGDPGDFKMVKSPMVGTFYTAPSPDAEPFVKVGSKVGADTPVCIIEAMKVMNEIQAEESGTVAEILIENGDPVEFGQPLFKLKA
ncbi:MAG: acetyl-CoA carboxylase biotin carboxyl carrier protein [Verrucomicrobiota bacterium]